MKAWVGVREVDEADVKARMVLEVGPVAPGLDYDGSMLAAMACQGLAVDGLMFVRVGAECVADYAIEKNGGQWSVHCHVIDSWQRRGVATRIYDAVEREAKAVGAVLVPSRTQTPDAKAFWAKRSGQVELMGGARLRGKLAEKRDRSGGAWRDPSAPKP